VRAEGDLDFRALSPSIRASTSGSPTFDCRSTWTPTADAEQLASLQRLTERYCVVLQTISTSPRCITTLTS